MQDRKTTSSGNRGCQASQKKCGYSLKNSGAERSSHLPSIPRELEHSIHSIHKLWAPRLRTPTRWGKDSGH